MTEALLPTAACSRTAVQVALEEGLSAHFGRAVRLRALAAEPLDEQSTHPIDRLRVTLDDGKELPVIFKRLHDAPEPHGNRREVQVYRQLLTGGRFGAPELYASVCDATRGRYWLFLEDVGAWLLHDGDWDDWFAAVRWLAEMHATYLGREEELRSLGCLTEHDERYYLHLARLARRHLELAEAGAALARYDRLMVGFDAIVAYLVRQPRTLVHGDIFPHNLMIQPGARIRPLDWESAGVGLGALDLTRLLDGWGNDKPRFLAAYLEALTPSARVPLDRRAFNHTLTCCSLLNVLWHLCWNPDDSKDAEFVNDRLDSLERYGRRLEEGCDG